ncbi:MAG TPA: TadE/TadG family type IV pilus assembly protein [Candidatus Sulfomarinibacteraceae bacterium]|nr:TadE/TadG family type IV pilus assembly protein [Candidatus Sulfomarinibacteraceae bacterium]
MHLLRVANLPLSRRRAPGQSLVEFAVILPVILLLLVALADLGRLYTSAVAIESAAREAADFGAFDASYWTEANFATTTAAMERRACTAAAGSHLEDYETTDPVDNTTCTNPTFECFLERDGPSAGCLSSHGFTNGIDCSAAATEPPCTVHVRMTYQFRLFLNVPPLPASIQVTRDSYFRISNLKPAGP